MNLKNISGSIWKETLFNSSAMQTATIQHINGPITNMDVDGYSPLLIGAAMLFTLLITKFISTPELAQNNDGDIS